MTFFMLCISIILSTSLIVVLSRIRTNKLKHNVLMIAKLNSIDEVSRFNLMKVVSAQEQWKKRYQDILRLQELVGSAADKDREIMTLIQMEKLC